MKIIDKTNYEKFIKGGILTIEDYTKVELKGINSLSIVANNNNEIVVGDNCSINCNNDNTIDTGSSNVITTGDNCTISGFDNNEISTRQNCTITVDDENNIVTNGYNTIYGRYGNTIEVEENSDITIYDEGKITLRGNNIILKVSNEGASNIVNNFSEDSVILTYDKKGRMKIYKTNKLVDEEIPIVNGKIGRTYRVEY